MVLVKIYEIVIYFYVNSFVEVSIIAFYESQFKLISLCSIYMWLFILYNKFHIWVHLPFSKVRVPNLLKCTNSTIIKNMKYINKIYLSSWILFNYETIFWWAVLTKDVPVFQSYLVTVIYYGYLCYLSWISRERPFSWSRYTNKSLNKNSLGMYSLWWTQMS